MNFEKPKYQKFENLTIKENLCYMFTISNPFLNSNDPIYKLISNFDEIKHIYNSNLKENKKFFYFNKEKIHDILYDLEEILKIDDDKEEIKLSELFYFSLLLIDNPVLIKYEISLNYIKKVNDLINKSKNNALKILLLSKIILILIYNFKGQNYYDENIYGTEIEKMKNDYISIIKNNLEILNFDLNYEDYIAKEIDYIYMKIILALIKKNDFNDIGEIIKIIEELDLKSINITEIIYKGLSEELDNKNDNYWNRYKIENFDDLKYKNIINFYYILLKYIFKNSLYIYNIKFLNENRKNLLNLLSKNFWDIKKLCEEEDKIEYIINNLTNSKYYLNSKGKNDGDQNNYSNNFVASIAKLGEEKDDFVKDFIGMNQENQLNKNISFIIILDEKFKNIVKSILQKSKIIIDIDKLNFQFYHGDKLNKNIDSDKLLVNVNYEKYIESQENDNYTKIIYKNYQKYLQFLKAIVEYLKHIKIKFNQRIILKLKRENSDVNKESKNKDYKDIYFINCEYLFINQINGNEELKFVDRNILINGINGNNLGFILLINELSDEDYSGAKFLYHDNITPNNNNNSVSILKLIEEA